jgi:4-hydroxy-3-polyprenylbenzoate decarboxylase
MRMGEAPNGRPRRIVVGITGATGAILGVRVLDALNELGVETHLCLSAWGARTIEHETGLRAADVRARAAFSYSPRDQGAVISSGSFPVDGAVVVPCTMKTLAAISLGLNDELISRAVDVNLKERRTVVLAVRETPLHSTHLENMMRASRLGAVIMPPVPAFYNAPATLDDMVSYFVARLLDQFGLSVEGVNRWDGQMTRPAPDVAP